MAAPSVQLPLFYADDQKTIAITTTRPPHITPVFSLPTLVRDTSTSPAMAPIFASPPASSSSPPSPTLLAALPPSPLLILVVVILVVLRTRNILLPPNTYSPGASSTSDHVDDRKSPPPTTTTSTSSFSPLSSSPSPLPILIVRSIALAFGAAVVGIITLPITLYVRLVPHEVVYLRNRARNVRSAVQLMPVAKEVRAQREREQKMEGKREEREGGRGCVGVCE